MRLSYKINQHQPNEFIVVNNGYGYFMEMLESALGVNYGDLQSSYNTIVNKVNKLSPKDFLSISLL